MIAVGIIIARLKILKFNWMSNYYLKIAQLINTYLFFARAYISIDDYLFITFITKNRQGSSRAIKDNKDDC